MTSTHNLSFFRKHTNRKENKKTLSIVMLGKCFITSRQRVHSNHGANLYPPMIAGAPLRLLSSYIWHDAQIFTNQPSLTIGLNFKKLYDKNATKI